MRVHGLESTLGAVRVFAQLTIKIIVNGQYELRRGGDAGSRLDMPCQPRIRLFDVGFGLAGHTVRIDCAMQ